MRSVAMGVALLLFAATSMAKVPSAGTTHAHVSKGGGDQIPMISVYGEKVPVPVALQLLKQALARPWSSRNKDRNLVVCRTEHEIGTLFYQIHCETNWEYNRGALGIPATSYLSGPSVIPFWFNNRRVNPASLHALLNKLPPVGSSYTLRIRNHGKITSEWIFKKGRLVKYWEKGHHLKKLHITKSGDG